MADRKGNEVRIEGDVAILIDSKGLEIKVDVDKLEIVKPYTWYACRDNNTYYARTRIGKRMVTLHRFLTNAPDDLFVDHRNRNGLDNRMENLREATNQQNQANSGKIANCHSQHKGVTWHKCKKVWQVGLRYAGKHCYAGRFKDEHEAGAVYNLIAQRLHGEFAYRNVVREEAYTAKAQTAAESFIQKYVASPTH